MNKNGLIAGGSGITVTNHPVCQPMVWLPGSTSGMELSREDMSLTYNTGANDYGSVTALNENNHIAGTMFVRSTSGSLQGQVAVRWNSPFDSPTRLVGIPLGANTMPYGYTYTGRQNESDTLIGIGMLSSADVHPSTGPTAALRWTAQSTLAQRLDDLSVRPYGSNSIANDINDAGVTVGASDLYVNNVRQARNAVRWDPVTTAISPLASPPSSVGVVWSEAQQINNRGIVVGWAQRVVNLAAQSGFAVRWNLQTNTVAELANLGPTAFTFDTPSVFDLNESDVAVGLCYKKVNNTDVRRAVLWPGDSTQIIDLNDLLGSMAEHWDLQYATRVTDTGWVGGQAKYDDDGPGPGAAVYRAFSMLVPQAGTYGRGDANFDARINFDDLLLLAQHYGESNLTQDIRVGDFDLNGSVNFDDLLALAQHYESSPALLNAEQFGSAFAADWAMARSLVPEPALVRLFFAAVAVRRHRSIRV